MTQHKTAQSPLPRSLEKNAIEVTQELLQDWPLPMPDPEGGKDERGRILVVGGSREMPGAVILTAEAALRAGAGKLCVATGASIAQLVAQALPEARVIGLAETAAGGLCEGEIERLPREFDAVVFGPGMQDEAATVAFTAAALPRFAHMPIVLDALSMSVLKTATKQTAMPMLITPHAGEMAHLTGLPKESIVADAESVAASAAAEWQCVVALKGSTTIVADPTHKLWRHTGGNSGLAISGSGDVLAGIIAGLAARGASLEQATVWGVALHARAGDRLEERFGALGYLAREIAGQVPRLMHALGQRPAR